MANHPPPRFSLMQIKHCVVGCSLTFIVDALFSPRFTLWHRNQGHDLDGHGGIMHSLHRMCTEPAASPTLGIENMSQRYPTLEMRLYDYAHAPWTARPPGRSFGTQEEEDEVDSVEIEPDRRRLSLSLSDDTFDLLDLDSDSASCRPPIHQGASMSLPMTLDRDLIEGDRGGSGQRHLHPQIRALPGQRIEVVMHLSASEQRRSGTWYDEVGGDNPL
ncbi:hypothetical protein FIBSPDRAFT_895152 [Athelia psychrophila]|uniref:Uncharacterized protein n=1 Tax=Athelia psychrophila TaxID=1759441 RepID=A0A166EZ34_9AGAM|nr:hypothetical protein FIBSPDRAFT_895152 [Fibularhizoctonia sp. CBS 109695]